jgi:hypothetical protein
MRPQVQIPVLKKRREERGKNIIEKNSSKKKFKK